MLGIPRREPIESRLADIDANSLRAIPVGVESPAPTDRENSATPRRHDCYNPPHNLSVMSTSQNSESIPVVTIVGIVVGIKSRKLQK